MENPIPTLLQAMRFLGFSLPKSLDSAKIDEIIAWGVEHWQLTQLPEETQITTLFSNRVS